MKKSILLAMTFCIAYSLISQDFEETEILPSVNPTPSFGAPGYIAHYYHQSIFPYDIDLDGDLDIFYADHNDDVLKLLENIGENEFIVSHDFGPFEQSKMIEIVDSDGDGKIEVFINGSSGLVFYEQVQGSIFGEAVSIANVMANRAMIFGDFDGDEDLDLIAGSKVYKHDSSQDFMEEDDLGIVLHSQGQAADFNADGLDDFVIAGLSYFENQGGFSFIQTSQNSSFLPSHLDQNIRAIEDLDGDGNLEVYYTTHVCGSDWCSGNFGGAEYSGSELMELPFLGTNNSNPILNPDIVLSISDFEGDGSINLNFSYFFDFTPPFQKGLLSLDYGKEAIFENTDEVFALNKTVAYYLTEDFDGDGDEDMLIAYLDNQLTIVDNKRIVCSSDNFNFQPTGQDVDIVAGTATIHWDAYPNATKCQISGNNDLYPNDLSFIIETEPAQASTFSKSFNLQANTTYRWKVRCGCSASPLIASDFTPYHYFTTPAFQGEENNSILNEVEFKLVEETISIAPNPSRGNVQILGISEDVTIELYDFYGRLVLSLQTNQMNEEIDLGSLSKGTYQIKVKGLKTQFSQQIVLVE
ncbi:MAG: T9SS type A sorting domain-containing protein [Bacteroidota bacterium]